MWSRFRHNFLYSWDWKPLDKIFVQVSISVCYVFHLSLLHIISTVEPLLHNYVSRHCQTSTISSGEVFCTPTCISNPMLQVQWALCFLCLYRCPPEVSLLESLLLCSRLWSICIMMTAALERRQLTRGLMEWYQFGYKAVTLWAYWFSIFKASYIIPCVC